MNKFDGKISLSINSVNEFDEDVDEIMHFKVTEAIQKGRNIISVLEPEQSSWLYWIKFNDGDFACQCLNFYKLLLERQQSIEELKTRYEVCIEVYISSDYGQFGETIPSELLKMAAQLDIDVDFHIFSFGLV